MVCRDGGIICVPNHSMTGTRLCLPADVKCDGTDDCLNGVDEEDCGGLQTPGLKALVGILVIAAVITAAVVGYVLFRRSQGKPAIPAKLRAMGRRLFPCCAQTKDGETSSQQLNVTENRSTSPSSIDKNGFTNTGFEGNPTSTQIHSKHSVTGKPLNKFRQTAQTDSDRVPSYRDWQSNRLQPPAQSSSNSHNMAGQIQHKAEINEQPVEQDYRVNNNITYAPSVQRQGPRQQPYAIASTNATNSYERPSYSRQTYSQHANKPNQYLLGGGGSQGLQMTYSSASTAVAADELREALEKVAVAPSHSLYNQRSPGSTASDTVV